MGSAVKLLTAGSQYKIAKANVDAARISQKAHNASQLSLVESKKIIQSANNAAAELDANSRRQVQGANNNASDAIAAGQKLLQKTGNADADLIAGAQHRQQDTYNEQSILVTEAKKTLQASRNERAASDSDLALWSQSLRNSQKLDMAGREVGQIAESVSAGIDRAVIGTIQDRLKTSAVLGASIAQAAAAGVGGSSVQAYSDALRISTAFQETTQDEELTTKVVDAYRQRGNVMGDAVASLDHAPVVANMDHSVLIADQNNNYVSDTHDYSAIFAAHDFTPIEAVKDFTAFIPDIDYTQYVDPVKPSGVGTVLTFAAAAVATYFGGPSAGNAVLDAGAGLQDMQQGNFSQAQQEFSGAFKGAVNGFNTYRAGADGSSSGTPWGRQFFNSGTTPTFQSSTRGQPSLTANSFNWGI